MSLETSASACTFYTVHTKKCNSTKFQIENVQIKSNFFHKFRVVELFLISFFQYFIVLDPDRWSKIKTVLCSVVLESKIGHRLHIHFFRWSFRYCKFKVPVGRFFHGIASLRCHALITHNSPESPFSSKQSQMFASFSFIRTFSSHLSLFYDMKKPSFVALCNAEQNRRALRCMWKGISVAVFHFHFKVFHHHLERISVHRAR